MTTIHTSDEHEVAHLAADAVVFARHPRTRQLLVLLVQRKWEPNAGLWALPGGHLDIGETDQHAAQRECAEETGIRPAKLRYVGSYRDPFRDLRYRVASWAWTSLLDAPEPPIASDDAAAAAWWPVSDALDDPSMWAFNDHKWMVIDAHTIIQADLESRSQ